MMRIALSLSIGLFIYAPSAVAETDFLNACIESETGTRSECKCLLNKLGKNLSNKERRFLIVLMGDDDAKIDAQRRTFSQQGIERVLGKLQAAAFTCA